MTPIQPQVSKPPPPPTTDVLLITLNSDMQTSRVDNVSLTPEKMIITNVDNDSGSTRTYDTIMLDTPGIIPQSSGTNDVFLVPAPKTTISRLTGVRTPKCAQKAQPRPPSNQTQYIINPQVAAQPKLAHLRHEKMSNDNSLLRALIQRPSMKINSNPVMRPFIPNATHRAMIRPTHSTGAARTVALKQASRSVTKTATSFSPIVSHREANTRKTETITSYVASPAVPRLTYGTTTTILPPVATVSYTAARSYAQQAVEHSRFSAPFLIPLSQPTPTISPVHRPTAQNVRFKPYTTSTITSYTITTASAPVKILTTESLITTVTQIDSFTKVTYTSRARRPVGTTTPSQVVPMTTATMSTCTLSPTYIQNKDREFLEPLPVSEVRMVPAARTFSGPRKVAVAKRTNAPSGTQRVIIRHSNPVAFAEKMLKNPAPLHKIADQAVTMMKSDDVPATVTTAYPTAVSHPITSSISFATTSGGTTHTLIVPHYKNTVFKNLSSLTRGELQGSGASTENSPRCSTERIVIRRPVAYFSPRRTFPCVHTTQQPTAPTTTTQRTIIRTLPLSLGENRLYFTRDATNVPLTLPEQILAHSPSTTSRNDANVTTTR